MSENRDMVMKIKQLRGETTMDEPVKIRVMSDGSYNNCHKGRGFSQPGTQAFLPIIEDETAGNFVIEFGVANKLCKACTMRGTHHTGHCSANYKATEPIGNAERILAGQLSKDMASSRPLLVSTVISDNDSKLINGFQDGIKKAGFNYKVTKEDCTIHAARRQRNLVWKQQWSGTMLRHSAGVRRQRFMFDLANAITTRCFSELQKTRKHHQNDTNFFLAAKKARETILPCFQGDHGACHGSYVCQAKHHVSYIPRHLPGRIYLSMTGHDKLLFMKVINHTLCDAMISRQLHCTSTNKCEAIHKKVFKAVPKTNTFSRNVYGRANSQILGASLGIADATIKLCNEAKTPLLGLGPGRKALKNLREKEIYQMEYRKKFTNKKRRKVSDARRHYLKRAHGSAYESDIAHPVHQQHNYAKNIFVPV